MYNAAVKTDTMSRYTLKIVHDDEPFNPREGGDSFGKMVCWHSRYHLGDKHNYTEPQDFLEALVSEDALENLCDKDLMTLAERSHLIIPLYLLDHSGITISTRDFRDRWDSGQVGWVYASHADIAKEYGDASPENIDKARRLMNAEVETYDCYLRGECYGFRLYRDGEEVDSCWGFLGSFDEAKDAIREYLPEDAVPLADNAEYGDNDDEWEGEM